MSDPNGRVGVCVSGLASHFLSMAKEPKLSKKQVRAGFRVASDIIEQQIAQAEASHTEIEALREQNKALQAKYNNAMWEGSLSHTVAELRSRSKQLTIDLEIARARNGDLAGMAGVILSQISTENGGAVMFPASLVDDLKNLLSTQAPG